MKKLISILFVVALLMSVVFCTGADAVYNDYLEGDFHSDCVILYCTDNDEIIFSKNPNKQTKPASLTKVITATVVLNECSNLNETVTVPQTCIDELADTGSSTGGLVAGEQYTVYQLLCCLLIKSANDAATTLANYVTGSDRQAFVDKMNALADELGCTNSHFMNVHGLDDDDQYVSAADMVKFFRNAMKNSTFREIACMTECDLPATNAQDERTITTTNKTLLAGYTDYYCKYSTGGKTGNTSGAGHCLVSAASNDGYNYIACALNGIQEDLDGDKYEENGAFVDVKNMYDWAFSNLRLVPVASSAKVVTEIPVKYGKGTDYVTLCPSENSFGLMPKGIDQDSLLIKVDEKTVPKSLKAPIKEGQTICKGYVYYANNVVAQVDLVASAEVKISPIAIVESIIDSIVFKIFIVVAILILVLLIYLKKKSGDNRNPDRYKSVKYKDYAGKHGNQGNKQSNSDNTDKEQ